jgi:hypothetical protein
MNNKLKKLHSSLLQLGLRKAASEVRGLLRVAAEEALPKRFPLAFRYWIRDSYYREYINQTWSPKYKGIAANSLFKNESVRTKSKIYDAWKMVIDAKSDSENDERDEREKADVKEIRRKPVQQDLFEPLRAKSLSSWLLKNNHAKEAAELLRILKSGGVKPIPVNRAEMNYITDELLKELKEKLLDMEFVSLTGLEGLGFSPLMLHDAALNTKSRFFEATEISPIIDINYSEEDIVEQIRDVGNIFMRSKDYSEAAGAMDELVESLKKENPALNSHLTPEFLEQQFINSRQQNISDYLDVSVSMDKKNVIGDDIIVNYLLLFSDNAGQGDAYHSSDLSKKPAEHTIAVTYNSGSLSLQNAILKFKANQISADETYEDEADSFIRSIKPYVLKSLIHEETHAQDIISPYNLSGSTQWAAKGSDDKRTLNYIAEASGVKGGALRLLIVNYNKLFGDYFGIASSYEEVYNRFHSEPDIASLLDKPVPEDKEISLIPSYRELYFYDKGFYVLSREELKAHLNDILTELLEAFEEDLSLDINALEPDDLINLSDTAMGLVSLAKKRPVDSLIKTPLGFLDIFKEKRTKDFHFGMRYIHKLLRDKLSPKA